FSFFWNDCGPRPAITTPSVGQLRNGPVVPGSPNLAAYHRPRPPPPPLFLRGPPNPPRPPPPPVGFGRASFTFIARPFNSAPFNWAIALRASSEFVISTKAKP